MTQLKDSTILVTGGAGFLGSHVVEELEKQSPAEIIIPRSSEYDFRKRDVIDSLISKKKPDIVIHLAGRVGGIGETRAKPAEFFYDNASMALNLVDS